MDNQTPDDLASELVYENTIHASLGIRALEVTSDRVVLEMDVSPTVHQPMGLLHGGASAVMAESAASMGTFMNCEPGVEFAVGVDLNITHLRAKRSGTVTATALPVRKGRTVHVWNIDIVGEDGKQVAVARCTLAVRKIVEQNS
jgi:1,4-dihydroxy-2-naphthoyl-CoA hydrolase